MTEDMEKSSPVEDNGSLPEGDMDALSNDTAMVEDAVQEPAAELPVSDEAVIETRDEPVEAEISSTLQAEEATTIEPVEPDNQQVKKASFFSRLLSGFKPGKRTSGKEQPAPESLSPESLPAAESQEAHGVEGVPEPISMDRIRELVQEELKRVQETKAETPEKVMAELVQERRTGMFLKVQKEVDETLNDKGNLLSERLKVVDGLISNVLTSDEIPALEKVQMFNALRSVEIQLEQDYQSLEARMTERSAERVNLDEKLESNPVVSSLREEITQQKELLSTVTARAARRVLVPISLFLLLFVVLGAAALVYFNPFKARAEESARVLVESASLYQASQQDDDALRVLDEITVERLENAELLGRIGEMYRILKQYDKAVNVLNLALAKDPNDKTNLLSLARSYVNQGSQADAIPVYQKLVGLEPVNITYLAEMVGSYRAIKDYNEAFANLDKILAIRPTYYQAYNIRGDIYREQQKWDDAIAQYQKALGISDNYLSHLNMGISYAGKREYDPAIEQYTLATGIAPERADPYYYSAEAYVALGNPDQAIPLYKQAISANEQHIFAYIGLGKIYMAQNDCVTALPYFQQALKYNSRNEDALLGVSTCSNKTQ